MLGVGGLSPPPLPPPLCLKPPTTFFCQPFNNHSFISPELHYNPFILKRSGFCLFARKKQKNSSLSSIRLERKDFDDDVGLEVDEDEDEDVYDEFDEDLDDVDDETDNDGDDDDDELMVPFHKMDEWLRRKPKGFGEGKVYDTSIEDKLLEELEKIREAQVANVNKLKNEPKVPELKKELNEVKASEVAPGCVRVRINNLPKKKNIQRDLKSAFEGVQGITNILPVVSGTKKTRDPVCKGFSFVDFKSLEDANRFVQLFSGQNIAFGKTEKRIKCEILKPMDASIGGSVHDGYNDVSESRSTVLEEKEGDQVGNNIAEYDPQLESWEDEEDADELEEDSDDEEIVANVKSLNIKEKSDIESIESRLLKQAPDPLPRLPAKPKEKRVRKKKPVLQKKSDSATKLKIPGSAKRLKVHEKAKLADVYSRYGVKQEALASNET